MKNNLNTPFNVMRYSRWEAAPRMPQAVGAAILGLFGTAGASFATASIFGITGAYAVGYLATTALTSWALRKLMPTPDLGAANRGTLLNARQPAAPQEYVYGQVRKGGVITFMETSGAENKYLHLVISMAGHEVEEIGQVYINDEVVSIDANGYVTGRWNSKIRILKHLGAQTSATDNFANASTNLAATLHTDTSATSSFIGKGIAYIYARLEYDQDVFGGGIPTITAVVKGKKVYDPRTATTAYSDNAALCIRDYITAAYGLNTPSVDEAYFAAAANDCDDNIPLAAGGSQKRYTINGVVNASSTTGVAIADMLEAVNGAIFYGGGVWKLKVGVYESSVKSLTLDDFRSGISLPTRLPRRDNFNRVTGKFVYGGVYNESSNPNAGDWVETDFPAIESAAFLSEDNSIDNTLDISLNMVTDGNRAQRIAKQKLFRSREQLTLSAEFGLSAMGIEVGDIIDLTIAKYGWTNKEFEVVNWRLILSDAGGVRVAMTLRETSSAAFDWGAEESQIISNNTTLPTYYTVTAPTALTLTATSVVNDDGITIPAIRAAWTSSNDAFVQYYEIQYKRLGGEEDYGSVADAQDDADDWGSITVAYTLEEDYGLTNEDILTPDADYVSSFGTTTSFLIQPVLNGYEYNVRVRAVNGLGVRSAWASATLASAGDTTPPNEPLSLAAVAGYKAITLSWINPADQDLAFVEIWMNTVNNLASATLIGSVFGTNFTVPNLPNNSTRYFWARAVDYSLNKSDFTSVASATTLLIEPNDFSDAVNDLFSEAGAFGIEPVSSLPASGGFDGQLVLLLPEITIYRWDAATSSWSTDIYTASSVEAGSITYASFAAGIEPVGVVDTLPTVSGYDGPTVVVLTTDGKLYRLVSGAWTAAINTADIEGTIGENLFSDDLRPIERVGTLPTTGLTQGRVVLLTTDNKLYRYTGSAWTSAVPATDLTGQIDGTQIADAAVTASKIGAAAVTTAKLANDAVTADILAANSVTETSISDGAISTPKLQAGSVTATTIASAAISADKLAANSVTASAIAAGSIQTSALAAGAVTASTIAAGAIEADKLAANSVTASAISANSVTATAIASDSITSSKIASSAISADKLAANSVTATAIAADAVTADAIAANSVGTDALIANSITTAKVAAGAISADQIASSAITTDKLFSGSVDTNALGAEVVTAGKIAAGAIITSKIAAGAVTADKITVSELSAISADLGTIVVNDANIGNISAAKITTGELDVRRIVNGDITQSSFAKTDASVYFSGSTWVVAQSLSITTSGGQLLLQGNLDINRYLLCEIRIRKGSSTILVQKQAGCTWTSVADSFARTGPMGNFIAWVGTADGSISSPVTETYYLEGRVVAGSAVTSGGGLDDMSNRFMVATEFKR